MLKIVARKENEENGAKGGKRNKIFIKKIMANSNPNQDNLTPFEKLNSDRTVIEIQKAGGIASGKSRRVKKNFAKLGKAMVDNTLTPEQIIEIKKEFPDLSQEDLTNRALMLQKQIQKAIIDGDTKAFEVIRDTIGEKPTDKLITDNGELRKTVVITEKELADEEAKMRKEFENT